MNNKNYLSPNELSILANIVAIILAEGRSANEVNILGNFVSAVGSLLSTIAAQQQSLQDIKEKEAKNSKTNNN